MKKLNNQTAFWEAMKEKYERRNGQLRQQELCLRQRLEELQRVMEKNHNDCDAVPEKLETQNTSLVKCLVDNAKHIFLGSCKCDSPCCEKGDDTLLCACPLDLPDPKETCPNLQDDETKQPILSVERKSSSYSLSSSDIYYMEKLKDLVKTEKEMKDQIDALRSKERNYMASIQECGGKSCRQSPIRYDEFNELHEENAKLRNDLEELRLELKHCFDRVEGPVKYTLESERKKRDQLEKELQNVKKCRCFERENYVKDINAIKAELCTACCNLVDLSNANALLKTELNNLKERCNELEQELCKQKAKEAESIMKFKNVLARRLPSQNGEEELSTVANKLSCTLKTAIPCLKTISPELAVCVNSIKNLSNMIGEKNSAFSKKGKECTCLKNKSLAVQTKPKILVPKIFEIKHEDACCSCSNPNPPTIIAVSSKQLVPKKSKSCTCVMPEKIRLEAKCSCNIDSNSQETKTKQSISDDCKRALEDFFFAKVLESRPVGPSEEFMAERTFYCEVPNQYDTKDTACSCEIMEPEYVDETVEEMHVNTKVDILDKAPENIHVTTTVSPSGTLEVVTEGPPGLIETKVRYLEDGKIEINTQLVGKSGDIIKLLGENCMVPIIIDKSEEKCIKCVRLKTCEEVVSSKNKVEFNCPPKTFKQTVHLYNINQIKPLFEKLKSEVIIEELEGDEGRVAEETPKNCANIAENMEPKDLQDVDSVVEDLLEDVTSLISNSAEHHPLKDTSDDVQSISSNDSTDESDEYRINRNMGATNLLVDRDLRASKSLIDWRGRHEETIRPCRSAIFGEDMAWEFVCEGPRDKADEGGDRPPPKTVRLDDLKKLIFCEENGEETENKEELTSQIPPSVTFQCYVCRCGKREKPKCKKTPPPPSNLEQRIDRLLEINPLTVPHGPNCQCVDCLYYNTARGTSIQDESSCQCSEPCPCTPCTHPKKPGCTCNAPCACVHCSNALATKPDDSCPCDSPCPCVPCGRSTKPREAQKPSLELCPCKAPCPCVPCARTIAPHAPDCTCVDCLCDPMKFKADQVAHPPKVVALPKLPMLVPVNVPIASRKDKKKCVCCKKKEADKKIACDCAPCACGTCADPSVNPNAKPLVQEPPKNPEPIVKKCDCGTCACAPCSDPERRARNEATALQQRTAQEEHPPSQVQPNAQISTETRTAETRTTETRTAETRTTETHTDDEEPNIPTNNPDTWRNVYVTSRAANRTDDDCPCMGCTCFPCAKMPERSGSKEL